MKSCIEIKQTDVRFYENNLKAFLPDEMIDIHAHIWLDAFRDRKKRVKIRSAAWPSMVALDDPVEDLVETYRILFPDKHVTPLIFAFPENDICMESSNRYVKQCSNKLGFPSLLLAHPVWDSSELREKLFTGGFLGIKVYLNYAPDCIQSDEIRISDFLPRHQLDVINEFGGMIMLHIPRSGRIKDPANLSEIIDIAAAYPELKLVIAHIGRAYCNEDLGNAFDVLLEAGAGNIYFDISANTNQWIFEKAIGYFGAGKILFGSDLPITRMRCRRICEDGKYVNIVPKGMYGNVSNDPHMRETECGAADEITFFIYEELNAFKKAAEAAGLTDNEIKDVFYNNAAGIIGSIRNK